MSTDQKYQLGKKMDAAIKMLGDDHTLCIVASLCKREMRFNELQRSLKLNPTTLTARLGKLEKLGIISKDKETIDKISVVYKLTDKGIGILPIVKEFEKFAEKFL